MSSTASEIKEAGYFEEMALLHGSNRLSSPEQVRRRVPSGKSSPDGSPRICRQQSFGREIGHAAAETYLITRLSFNLLGYLGYSFRNFHLNLTTRIEFVLVKDCNLLDRESNEIEILSLLFNDMSLNYFCLFPVSVLDELLLAYDN